MRYGIGLWGQLLLRQSRRRLLRGGRRAAAALLLLVRASRARRITRRARGRRGLVRHAVRGQRSGRSAAERGGGGGIIVRRVGRRWLAVIYIFWNSRRRAAFIEAALGNACMG